MVNSPNVPNPFNPEIVIRYQLREESAVNTAVYDILGRRVTTLVEEVQQGGHYSIAWDGCDESGEKAAAGIYFYHLQAGSFTQTRKMALVK